MQSFKDFIAEAEEQGEKFNTEFKIPVHNLDWMKKKIDKLNKVAAKLNVVPIQYTIGEKFTEIVEKSKDSKFAKYMDFCNVTVTGEAPKLSGWTFVGKLEPIIGASGVMAKTAPGMKQLPKKYQHVDHISCEHCNKNVRRNESFIVKKGRTYKQVGRSCLKDFLGHEDPKKIADWAEVLYDIRTALTPDEESEGEYSSRGFYAFDAKDVIARAMHSIKEKGFKSRQYSDYPTSVIVLDSFMPPKYTGQGGMTSTQWFDQFKIEPTKEEFADAEEMIKHAQSVWSKSNNEFELNNSKILSGKVIDTKNFGYVVAGANSWMKLQDKISAQKVVKDETKDEHIGIVGDKHVMNAIVLSSHIYQGRSYSYYHNGMKAIVMFKTDTGHLVKMFTSNTSLQKGDKVQISGKIGHHDVETYDKSPFRGLKITTMAPGARIKEVVENSIDLPKNLFDKTVTVEYDGKSLTGVVDTHNKKTGEMTIYVNGKLHVANSSMITKVHD